MTKLMDEAIDVLWHVPAEHQDELTRMVMHLLLEHPNVGSATNRSDVRRIVVFPFPYAIFLSRQRQRNHHSWCPPHRAPVNSKAHLTTRAASAFPR